MNHYVYSAHRMLYNVDQQSGNQASMPFRGRQSGFSGTLNDRVTNVPKGQRVAPRSHYCNIRKEDSIR